MASKWDKCEALISLNIESSLSEGTKKSYNYWCGKFRTFCAEVDRESHQFNSKTVCGFLSSLAEQSAGVGGVDQARAALRYDYLSKFPNEKSPTEAHDVSATIKGIKRRFSTPVQKKKPLASSDFSKLISCITKDGNFEEIKFCDFRFAAQLAVLFCTFSRYEETSALCVASIVFEESDVVVNFPKGKQYQFGEARSAVISETSVILLLKAYIKKLKALDPGNQILFPSLRQVGKNTKLLQHTATYDCVRKQFKHFAALANITGNPDDYGLHSMRRGAVTAAVNHGCQDHIIAKQMRVSGLGTVHRYATLDKKSLRKASLAVFSS